jgi:thiol-disulfide isomerase/thioredoxin
MKKTTLSALVLIFSIALTGAGCSSTATTNNQSDTTMEQKDDSKKDETMMEKDTKKDEAMMNHDAMDKDAMDNMMDKKDMMVKAGIYEDYAPAKLALAKTGKVVLFFKAGWCSTCKQVDGDITTNLDKIPQNVTILKIDYDNSTDLKKKYGVTTQHTFVQVDENGKLIKKWLGSPTLSDLASKIQ